MAPFLTLIPSVPRLEDIPWIMILVLIFTLIDLLGLFGTGILNQQFASVKDTHTSRSFSNMEMSSTSPLSATLFIQFFLFSGLTLFCALEPEAPILLSVPSAESLRSLLLCMAAPLVWFVLQWIGFNWTYYLFGDDERISILNRLYRSIHLLASPLALVLFLGVLVGLISPEASLYLLASLFILTQGVFIFSAFKIFSGSFLSLCFIIVYLCALEIAPLLIIWHKIA